VPLNTVAWKIPENYVMAIEASDSGCISWPTFKLRASLLDIIVKSK
jgi:hypothetical protein